MTERIVSAELTQAMEDSFLDEVETLRQSSIQSPISTGSTFSESLPDYKRQKNSLVQQFRTGSGWFAPLVPPEREPTWQEREEMENARIRKLREKRHSELPNDIAPGTNNTNRSVSAPVKPVSKPSMRRRASSGVEMFVFRLRGLSVSSTTDTPPPEPSAEADMPITGFSRR